MCSRIDADGRRLTPPPETTPQDPLPAGEILFVARLSSPRRSITRLFPSVEPDLGDSYEQDL